MEGGERNSGNGRDSQERQRIWGRRAQRGVQVGWVEGFYFYSMMLYRNPDYTTKEHRSKTQSKANSSIIKLEKQKQDPFASSWYRVLNGKRKRKKEN